MKIANIISASKINDTSFIKRLNGMIISCDGGYKYLKKENIEPDLFIGDFDTLKEDDLISPKEVIKLPQEKDDTDTLYAIKEGIKRGYDTFYLFGCLNGKLDHSLANIQILEYLSNRNIKGYLFDSDNSKVIFLLKNSSITFNKTIGKISVFSYSSISKNVSETNLKYEIKNKTLYSSFPIGISNEFIKDKEASISVEKGTLLIYSEISSLSFF